jgi:hypothetical protein
VNLKGENMFLELKEEEIEIIEETLSVRMIETKDTTLLPIIKKIRTQMDDCIE